MKTIRRVCKTLLLLALCLALLPGAAGAAKKNASSGSEIRVLLRRLNLTSQVYMTLQGRYLARCANGTEILLPANARVTVLLRNKQIILFCGGLSLSAGKSLDLLRQQAGDTVPGIRFNLQKGLYPGDLMDPSADWDVVDTTNDQVFKGLLEENKNTANAVAGTEGLVLTYGKKLITAWYSASNGGQTELPQHVWGGSDIPPCFALTDDPWDAENPDSLTRKATLKKDGSNLSPAFLRLLRNALVTQEAYSAFRLDEGAPFRVDAVREMRLSDPRYEEPSRLMTRLQVVFDFTAELKPGRSAPEAGEQELDIRDLLGESTPTPAQTPAPTASPDHPETASAACTVTLDIFPGVINALGISISGADNEIVSLTEDDSSFTLTSGRFGHGVGLSQRGAQYQASKDGRGFEEILAFYYPGAVIKQYSGETAPLPAPDPVLAETPGPAPTATPRPTLMPVTEALPEDAWLASVENIDDDSSLNLRSEPSPAAEIVMRLYKHQRLIVLEYAEVNGWVRVKTDAAEGYVMYSFLKQVKK